MCYFRLDVSTVYYTNETPAIRSRVGILVQYIYHYMKGLIEYHT